MSRRTGPPCEAIRTEDASEPAPTGGPAGISFEVRPLAGGRRSRASLISLAWVVALGVLVGGGAIGHLLTAEPSPTNPLVSGITPAEIAPTLQIVPAPAPLEAVIDLTAPAVDQAPVTTARLTVRGQLLVRAAEVEVDLGTGADRLFARKLIDVTDQSGDLRPDWLPRLSLTLDLPVTRPAGEMWLDVIVYNARGLPMGGVFRSVDIGPLT